MVIRLREDKKTMAGMIPVLTIISLLLGAAIEVSASENGRNQHSTIIANSSKFHIHFFNNVKKTIFDIWDHAIEQCLSANSDLFAFFVLNLVHIPR